MSCLLFAIASASNILGQHWIWHTSRSLITLSGILWSDITKNHRRIFLPTAYLDQLYGPWELWEQCYSCCGLNSWPRFKIAKTFWITSQWYPRLMSPYVVTGIQGVKKNANKGSTWYPRVFLLFAQQSPGVGPKHWPMTQRCHKYFMRIDPSNAMVLQQVIRRIKHVNY